MIKELNASWKQVKPQSVTCFLQNQNLSVCLYVLPIYVYSWNMDLYMCVYVYVYLYPEMLIEHFRHTGQ